MNDRRRILVTGGAGFIGSALCMHLDRQEVSVVNVDKLAYARNLTSLSEIIEMPNYTFLEADICNKRAMREAMSTFAANTVMHLAAESHIGRSIDGPAAFVETIVVGKFSLLSAALAHWRELPAANRETLRFQHISTDEEFGDLAFDSGIFTEAKPYAPSSPYSASRAVTDHFVRACYSTCGLPVVMTNCPNNNGPFHFPEKLIPLVILSALDKKNLPVYGKGTNVRDWLYVDDHVRALEAAVLNGRVGESYNIGGRAERTNLAMVEAICSLLDKRRPRRGSARYHDLITQVSDRPGHDRRYAIDPFEAERVLDWKAVETFDSGLEKAVHWYLANGWWRRLIREQRYDGGRPGTS